MDNLLLLVKCVTLLYRESLLATEDDGSASLVREVLATVSVPEIASTPDVEAQIGLKATALDMSSQPAGTKYVLLDLLQRLSVNCAQSEATFESIKLGLAHVEPQENHRLVVTLRNQLRSHMRRLQAEKLLTDASKTVLFKRDSISDFSTYVRDIVAKLEPYSVDTTRKDPAIVSRVRFTDEEELSAAYSKVHEATADFCILKTGWCALNEMLQGGFRLGEFWVISALQHQNKTGATLALFKQLCNHNTPEIRKPGTKPMALRISTEDSMDNNLATLYKNIWQNETGKIPDMREIEPKEVARYVQQYMQRTGFTVEFVRVNPSEWGYKDLQNFILSLESEGYDVQICMVDYLPMLQKTGCNQGVIGEDVQDMVQRLRNFFSVRGTLFITPWQLSTEAKMLIRDGATDFAKQVVGKGYYKHCRSLDQEPDGELHIHIESFNGIYYQAFARGKHRGVDHIDAELKYFLIPFAGKGCLLDDVKGPRTDKRKLNGPTTGQADAGDEDYF